MLGKNQPECIEFHIVVRTPAGADIITLRWLIDVLISCGIKDGESRTVYQDLDDFFYKEIVKRNV